MVEHGGILLLFSLQNNHDPSTVNMRRGLRVFSDTVT